MCVFITSALVVIMLSLIFFNFAYWHIPHYTLSENILQLSSTYCDDTLIGLTSNCLYIYGVSNTDTIKLDKHYKKFCAKSKNDIMLIDNNNKIYHYNNGNFNNMTFKNDVLDVTYIWKSYIILDDKNNVFIENKFLCNLGIDANPSTIAGTLDVSYDLKDIWFLDNNNMLCAYNLISNKLLTIGNVQKYTFTPTGSMYISMEGKAIKITRQNYVTYNFVEIDCTNKQINEIVALESGYGYLLLSENSLQRIKSDLSGNYFLYNNFSDISDSFQQNIFNKDLIHDWNFICFMNNINDVENIFTSPYSENIHHQIFYLKENLIVYVYEQ